MTQHTQGTWVEWKLAPDSDSEQRSIITTEDGETEITGIVYNPADISLIAAAPELLEGMIEVYEIACIDSDTEELALAALSQIRAIAKRWSK